MCITATQFNPMYFLVNYKWMVAVWNVRIQKTLLFTMSFEDMGQICYLPIKKKKSFMYVHVLYIQSYSWCQVLVTRKYIELNGKTRWHAIFLSSSLYCNSKYEMVESVTYLVLFDLSYETWKKLKYVVKFFLSFAFLQLIEKCFINFWMSSKKNQVHRIICKCLCFTFIVFSYIDVSVGGLFSKLFII